MTEAGSFKHLIKEEMLAKPTDELLSEVREGCMLLLGVFEKTSAADNIPLGQMLEASLACDVLRTLVGMVEQALDNVTEEEAS